MANDSIINETNCKLSTLKRSLLSSLGYSVNSTKRYSL